VWRNGVKAPGFSTLWGERYKIPAQQQGPIVSSHLRSDRKLNMKIFLPGLSILFMCGCSSGFGPDYDKAEIKQNIGGTLICNSVHTADIQNYQHDVSYEYKDANDSIFDIGSGTYNNREWNKDEQLVQYKNWTILKTGNGFGTDKIIVGDLKKNKWTEYEFTPENIEKDSLWKSLNIHSLLNYCCSETFINKVKNKGEIQLHYKFRASENLLNQYIQKGIYYQIKDSTGQPIMTKIE
jgi:hypothetical protein